MRPFPSVPGQYGLATREQLSAAGWTPDARRHLVRTWGQQPLPGVYLNRRGPLVAVERCVAAALWAGEEALVTGVHALALLGLEAVPLGGPVSVLVPRSRRPRRAGFADAVRSTRWPRSRTAQGVRVAALERSLVDSGRLAELPAGQVTALTLTVLQRGLTTTERLLTEIAQGRRNGTAAVRAGIREFEDGVRSAAEVLLRRELAKHPFRFVLNPSLSTPDGVLIGYPDAYLSEVGLAVQLHSLRYHSGPDADGNDLWCLTVEHDSDFVVHGVTVLGVTPSRLVSSPQEFGRRLEEAVAALAGRPLPRVVVGEPLPGCRPSRWREQPR